MWMPPYSRTKGNFIGVGIFLPTYFTSMKDQPKEKIGIPSINDPFWILTRRLHLTKKQRVATSTFFNTSLLEPQKPDFSQKKATKVKDRDSPRLQRSKKFWLGKFFLFDFSPNWTILSHLAKVFFSAFFGLLSPLKATKAKKAKILLSKCIRTDCLSE